MRLPRRGLLVPTPKSREQIAVETAVHCQMAMGMNASETRRYLMRDGWRTATEADAALVAAAGEITEKQAVWEAEKTSREARESAQKAAVENAPKSDGHWDNEGWRCED